VTFRNEMGIKGTFRHIYAICFIRPAVFRVRSLIVYQAYKLIVYEFCKFYINTFYIKTFYIRCQFVCLLKAMILLEVVFINFLYHQVRILWKNYRSLSPFNVLYTTM